MAIGDADPILLGAGSHWDNLDGYTAANATGLYPVTFLIGVAIPELLGVRRFLTFSDSTNNHFMRVGITASDISTYDFNIDTDAGPGGGEAISVVGLPIDTGHLIAVTLESPTVWRAAANGAPITLTGTLRDTGNPIDSLWINSDRGTAIFEGTLAVIGVSHATPSQAVLNGITDGSIPIDDPGFAWQYLLGWEGTTLTAYAGSAGGFTFVDGGFISEPGTYDSAFEALGWPPAAGGVNGIGNTGVANRIRNDAQKHAVGVA